MSRKSFLYPTILLVGLLPLQPLLAQSVSMGTVIVNIVRPNEILLASDSKVTGSANPCCKIRQIGNIFIAAGGATRIFGYEPQEIAIEACRGQREIDDGLRQFEYTADSIMTIAIRQLHKFDPASYDVLLREFPDSIFVSVLFTGFEYGEPFSFCRKIRIEPTSQFYPKIKVVHADEYHGGTYVSIFDNSPFTFNFAELIKPVTEDSIEVIAGVTRSFMLTRALQSSTKIGKPIDLLIINKLSAYWMWPDSNSNCKEVEPYWIQE